MSNALVAGDVVRLITGGPEMVVQNTMPDGTITVTWFLRTGQLQLARIAHQSVVLVREYKRDVASVPEE